MTLSGGNGHGLSLMDTATAAHANTFTAGQTITPESGIALTLNPVVGSDGLKMQVPAYADSSHAGVHLTDTGTASSGPHLEVDQYGVGNGVDIHWFPHSSVGTTGGCALGVHGYRDPGAGQALVIIDNTDAGNSVKIKNTEGSNNPNSHGRGNFLELYGYTGATAHGTSDGTITSGQAVLTSASGTFTKKDEGKPIRVPGAGSAAGNLDTTILTYTSATSVTLATTASTSVTTANYIYPVVANVQQMAKVTGNAIGFGSVSTTNTGALRFINTQAGTSNLSASPWSFETNAGQCTAVQIYQPSGSGGGLLINMASSGFGMAIQKAGTNVWVGTPTGTDGLNVAVGTTTGLKIGTATTQKIGFYNATPVVQQTGVAVSAAGVHAALVSLGLITA